MATGPALKGASRSNRSRPRRWTTASRSTTWASNEQSGTSRSDSPDPLLSYRMSFLFSARRSYQRRQPGYCHSSWIWLQGDVRHLNERRAFTQRPEGDAHAVGGLGVLDARLHSAVLPYRKQTLRVANALQRVLTTLVEGDVG